jgi:hypothetical protein
MKDIRYWVSKVLTPEQAEVEKKPEPKHSVTEKMKDCRSRATISRSRKQHNRKNRIWNCKALAVFIVKMSGAFFVPRKVMQ